MATAATTLMATTSTTPSMSSAAAIPSLSFVSSPSDDSASRAQQQQQQHQQEQQQRMGSSALMTTAAAGTSLASSAKVTLQHTSISNPPMENDSADGENSNGGRSKMSVEGAVDKGDRIGTAELNGGHEGRHPENGNTKVKYVEVDDQGTSKTAAEGEGGGVTLAQVTSKQLGRLERSDSVFEASIKSAGSVCSSVPSSTDVKASALRSTGEGMPSYLPSELRRILSEVARSGTCSSLPWKSSDRLPLAATAAAASPPAASSSVVAPASGGPSFAAPTIGNLAVHRNLHAMAGRGMRSIYGAGSAGKASSSSSSSSRFPVRKKRRNGLHRKHSSRTTVATGAAAAAAAAAVAAASASSASATAQRSAQTPSSDGSVSLSSLSGGATRKRPISLITSSANGQNSGSPSSALAATPGISSLASSSGGRTSGSEMSHDDSTHYECDSEGTSTTTNSDLSFSGRGRRARSSSNLTGARRSITHRRESGERRPASSGGKIRSQYRSLRQAMRVAITLVLDYSYKTRGGYKPSRAEARRTESVVNNSLKKKEKEPGDHSVSASPTADASLLAEMAYRERRKRLLAMLGGNPEPDNDDVAIKAKDAGSATASSPPLATSEPPPSGGRGPSLGSVSSTEAADCTPSREPLASLQDKPLPNDRSPVVPPSTRRSLDGKSDVSRQGPPFTLQRVAEVLIAPDRYYAQTHKLCNALEKLLLVNSTVSAFGGATGGDTSQSRMEAQERAALATEQDREGAAQRQRRLQRHMALVDATDIGGDRKVAIEEPMSDVDGGATAAPDSPKSPTEGKLEESGLPKMMIGAPLVGRRRGDSFGNGGDSSPALGQGSNKKGVLRNGVVVEGGVEFDSHESHLGGVARGSLHDRFVAAGDSEVSPHQPQVAYGGGGPSHGPGNNANMLQQQPQQQSHMGRARSPTFFSSTGTSGPAIGQLVNGQLVSHPGSGTTETTTGVAAIGALQMEFLINPGANPIGTAAVGNPVNPGDDADVEAGGRSSASNSDIDSESGDDVSLDDSASDRSDGSDSGGGSLMEPFTAARVMTLNRIQQQQQQRREQYRASMASAAAAAAATSCHYQPVHQQPQLPEPGYQSGDSVDSAMAEDSCESDSSASDVAD